MASVPTHRPSLLWWRRCTRYSVGLTTNPLWSTAGQYSCYDQVIVWFLFLLQWHCQQVRNVLCHSYHHWPLQEWECGGCLPGGEGSAYSEARPCSHSGEYDITIMNSIFTCSVQYYLTIQEQYQFVFEAVLIFLELFAMYSNFNWLWLCTTRMVINIYNIYINYCHVKFLKLTGVRLYNHAWNHFMLSVIVYV